MNTWNLSIFAAINFRVLPKCGTNCIDKFTRVSPYVHHYTYNIRGNLISSLIYFCATSKNIHLQKLIGLQYLKRQRHCVMNIRICLLQSVLVYLYPFKRRHILYLFRKRRMNSQVHMKYI